VRPGAGYRAVAAVFDVDAEKTRQKHGLDYCKGSPARNGWARMAARFFSPSLSGQAE
jgi:hypothetical protein